MNIPALRFPEFNKMWVRKSVGEIAEVTAGATPSTLKAEYWNGNIRWMNSGELNLKKVTEVENRITELGLKNSSTKILPKYCVMIGLAGQGKTRGTVAINLIELCTNQSIGSILPNQKFIPNFLYHNLDNRYEELRSLSTGDGGRGGLNLQIIKSIIIPLPTLSEQTKIASFFSAIDEKYQVLKKKKSLLGEYKKGVMQKIFAQELRFKDDNGKLYPDWEEKKLGEIFSFKVTNSFSRENLNYEYGKVKNIHYGDIHTKFSTLFNIETENVPFVNSEIPIQRIREDNYCEVGDVIFADASEDLEDVGKSIEIFNVNKEKLLSGLHTILARPNPETFSIGFSGHLFKSPFVRTQIKKEAQGSKVLSISASRLSKILIPIPCIEEQSKIAEFLCLLDDKINHTKTQIEKTEAWKKGLLQKMFV